MNRPGIKIKICGLFREADVDFANDAEPDYIGFVFAESRRKVSITQAAAFRNRLRGNSVSVGVFVGAAPRFITELYQEGIIDMAQLHGAGDDVSMAELRELSAGTSRGLIPIIRALRAEDLFPEEPESPNSAFLGAERPDYLLLDQGGGGTGRSFNWKALGRVDLTAPGKFLGIPYFLAGGINLDNIREALGYRPFAVDVSSGAECRGVKDRDRMIRLVQKVRLFCSCHCNPDRFCDTVERGSSS